MISKRKIISKISLTSLKTEPLYIKLLLAIIAVTIVVSAIYNTNFFVDRKGKILTDFGTFYIAGKMFWSGTLSKAYQYEYLHEIQQQTAETSTFMPWSYPPQYDLLVAVLALFPAWLAYLLLVGVAFIAYAMVLKKLAGKYFGQVLLMVYPALLISASCGQNSFLTATLIGLFLLFISSPGSGGARAGIALGLMVIKPHLAAGITVLAVFGRHFGAVVMAAVIVLASAALATLILGAEIWPAFAHGTGESSLFLRLGLYPLFRMTSLYASLHSFGVSAFISLLVHILVAIIACLCIAVASSRAGNRNILIGTTVLSTIFISPYNYDYDLTILGLGLAALLPELNLRASKLEMGAIYVMSWFGCGWGMLQYIFYAVSTLIFEPGALPNIHRLNPYSVSGPVLLFLVLLIALILRRPLREA